MQLELTRDRLSDGELLGSYCAHCDQQAFATLVNRYEPMVKRVCRQVMTTGDQADDAAQQVFVALAEKAHTLQDQKSVASWLYRVAWNISSKTRRAVAIRQKHERHIGQMPLLGRSDTLTEPDAKLILQETISELPEMYREAIVLHYFCGFSTAETAARLRCPAGTVAARVSRGLDLLRKKLADRDLVLSIVAIKVILLAMSSRSKAVAAAAAATVVKGGLPRLGWRFLRWPRVRPVYAGSTLTALSTLLFTRAGESQVLSSTAIGARANSISLSDCFPNLISSQKWVATVNKLPKLSLWLLTGLCCAGAGTAVATVVNIVAPRPLSSPSDSQDKSEKPDAAKPPVDNNTSNNSAAVSGGGWSREGGTAVPEPGSAVLVAIGATVLLGRGVRKMPCRACC